MDGSFSPSGASWRSAGERMHTFSSAHPQSNFAALIGSTLLVLFLGLCLTSTSGMFAGLLGDNHKVW